MEYTGHSFDAYIVHAPGKSFPLMYASEEAAITSLDGKLEGAKVFRLSEFKGWFSEEALRQLAGTENVPPNPTP